MEQKLRILLLGEFSGLFTNLKIGLEELGHQVDSFHNGDGKKMIGNDYNVLLDVSKGKFGKYIYQNQLIKTFQNYDAVFLISVFAFSPFVSRHFFKILSKNNKSIFILSCGSTYELNQAVKKQKFKYYMFSKDKKEMFKYEKRIYDKFFRRNVCKYNEKYILSHCDGIIPIAYEYFLPFKNYKNIKDIIPLPYYSNEVISKINNDRIVIYHGLNRPYLKGSNYIVPALEKIKNNYPNEVEILIRSLIPFKEYNEIVKRADIIVDQCKSYCWGMNAVISMAKGKVVLSGAEKETLDYFHLKECPIINIIPDENQIYEEIEKLILNKELMQKKSVSQLILLINFITIKKLLENMKI